MKGIGGGIDTLGDFRMLPSIEEMTVEHTPFFSHVLDDWNSMVNLSRLRMPIPHPSFKFIEPERFTDRLLKQTERHIDEDKNYIYRGSMYKGVPFGPGSQKMEGGVVQFEGNYIDGKMTGQGYMVTFDDKGEVDHVITC